MKMKIAIMVVLLTGMSFFSYAQRILTIEQALDIAEDNNPSMRDAKLNYQRTQLTLTASRIALKPQFSMSVNPFGYSQSRTFDSFNSAWFTNKKVSSGATFQTDLPILLTDGTLRLSNSFSWQNTETQKVTGLSVNERFMNELTLRYDQPLFTYNRRKVEMMRYEFDHENSGINYALQRLRTEQSISRQFYTVYSSKTQLEINHAELENSQRNFEIIKAKVESGLSAREELFQAEVNLANAQSRVQQSEVSLKNAKDNLKQTLGMPLSEDIDVLVKIEVVPLLIDEKKAINSALTSRMELRQREINIETAEFEMLRVKAQNEFNGNLSLSLGVTGDDKNLGNIFDAPTQTPAISLRLSIPIFDWGQRKARIKAQEIAQTLTVLSYEDLKVDIELAIRQSLRSLENLRTQIEIAEKNVRNTELAYALYEIRYREGDLTGLQMSQYQSQLSSSRTSYTSAQISYINEMLNFKILTLYDFEKDQPIIPVRELSNLTIR